MAYFECGFSYGHLFLCVCVDREMIRGMRFVACNVLFIIFCLLDLTLLLVSAIYFKPLDDNIISD